MYQKLILISNLGNDPTMKYTPDGKAVKSGEAVETIRKALEAE